jgi:hypothetical protein
MLWYIITQTKNKQKIDKNMKNDLTKLGGFKYKDYVKEMVV